MGSHIIDGEFQSDKYPACPRGKVPLSTKDVDAQDLLWKYAERHEARDAEFSEDLKASLLAKGFVPSSPELVYPDPMDDVYLKMLVLVFALAPPMGAEEAQLDEVIELAKTRLGDQSELDSLYDQVMRENPRIARYIEERNVREQACERR